MAVRIIGLVIGFERQGESRFGGHDRSQFLGGRPSGHKFNTAAPHAAKQVAFRR
jgi:hypothetical protein